MYTQAWHWIGMPKLVNGQAASPFPFEAYSGHLPAHLRPDVIALFSCYWYKNISSHNETSRLNWIKIICGYKTSVKNEYMMLNYFDDWKYLNLFPLLMCIEFRQKSWEPIGVGLDGFSYCENLTTHIPFWKNLFLMLMESNSRNFLSEIITNNLEKLLIKVYRFQWDFSLQILSHCLRILNQTLSCNFYVISQRALLCQWICCVLMHILMHKILFMNPILGMILLNDFSSVGEKSDSILDLQNRYTEPNYISQLHKLSYRFGKLSSFIFSSCWFG